MVGDKRAGMSSLWNPDTDLLTNFGAFGSALGGLAGFAALVLMIWQGGAAKRQAHVAAIGEQLADPADCARMVAEFSQPTARDAWRAGVERLVATLHRWFGPPLGWSAFDMSLRIAFVYPIALFLLAWAAGTTGRVGDLWIAADGLPAWRRFGAVAILAATIAVTIWIMNNAGRLGDAVNRMIEAMLLCACAVASADKSAPRWIRKVVLLIGFATAIAGVHSGAAALAGAFAAEFVVAAFAGGAGFGVGAFATVLVLTFAGIGIGIGMGVGVGEGASAVRWIVFYIVLPIANAIFDFASWAATRALLDRITRPRAGWRGVAWLLAEILLDLAVAALCLTGLVAIMVFLLEAMNAFLRWQGAPIFDWRAALAASAAHPLWAPQNWTLVGMLASTVFPTALHLSAGLAGLALSLRPDGRALAGRIGAVATLSTGQKQTLAKDIVGYRARRNSVVAVLAPIFLVALLALLWRLAGASPRWLGVVADAAAAVWR